MGLLSGLVWFAGSGFRKSESGIGFGLVWSGLESGLSGPIYMVESGLGFCWFGWPWLDWFVSVGGLVWFRMLGLLWGLFFCWERKETQKRLIF
jgi:hypothetical protein